MMIVGSGVDLENEKQIAKDLGIDEHVTFTGRVPEEDKADLHRVGRLFAVASPAELQCIAALEAMASAQPIVAVSAGALSELCHDGENGYLFPLDDYNVAAQNIKKILDNDELHDKFANESLAIAKTHDLSNTLDRFVELYDEMILKKKAEIESRPVDWRDKIRESDFLEFMKLGRSDTDTDEEE